MPPVVHPIPRHTSAPQTLTTQLCSSLIIVLDLMMVRNGWAHGISKAVPCRCAPHVAAVGAATFFCEENRGTCFSQVQAIQL